MTRAHLVNLQTVCTPVNSVEANYDIPLRFMVSCAHGCNLDGYRLIVLNDKGLPVKEIELTSFDEQKSITQETSVKAPQQPGAYLWKALFPLQVRDEVEHGAAEIPFSFVVHSHTTSLAIWDIPSVTITDKPFRIKIGAKCLAAECSMSNSVVVVRDERKQKIAEVKLGSVPFPGTKSLQWTEVAVTAPKTEGMYEWETTLVETEIHAAANHPINFVTVNPPECILTLTVKQTFTKDVIPWAIVVLDRYQGETNTEGICKMEVPKGIYRLAVGRDGYHTHQSVIDVQEDMAINIELSIGPSFSHG